MDMTAYLNEMEHAATTTIELVWAERKRVAEMQTRLDALGRHVQDDQRRIAALLLNDDDDEGLATGLYWENYFGPQKEQHETSRNVDEQEALLITRVFSTAAQSASLLQYGKAGISLVHRGLSSCPSGRQIGSQSLRDVVWQGRNQGIHWEEGKPHPAVEKCFNTLKSDFGAPFDRYRNENLAFEVIQLLGWNDYAAFRNDMLSLA